jgi:hypothetical protein
MIPIHELPSKTSAEDGTVLVDGPGGVCLSVTPDAAVETAGRLIDAACEAKGQELLKERSGLVP